MSENFNQLPRRRNNCAFRLNILVRAHLIFEIVTTNKSGKFLAKEYGVTRGLISYYRRELKRIGTLSYLSYDANGSPSFDGKKESFILGQNDLGKRAGRGFLREGKKW